MNDIRNDCLNLIGCILDDKRPSHLVIAEYLSSNAAVLSAQDRSFVKKLVQGVVERALTLDYVIGQKSSTPVKKLKPVIRNLLRMGAYQIIYMKVPDSAACNEAVKIAKKRKLGNLSGFVNAVLRGIAAQKEELTDFSQIPDKIKRLSVMYSMPVELTKYIVSEFGEAKAEGIFEYYLTDNLTSIRCNISKISSLELKERLVAQEVKVQDTILPKAFKISGYSNLESLKEFTDGLFTVQDLSSILSGESVEIRGNERILDLCAAPGGKSLNLADRLLFAGQQNKNSSLSVFENADSPGDLAESKTPAGVKSENELYPAATVVSCDISDRKVKLIDENISRCGFNNIVTRVNDAAVFNPDFEECFDVVVADVPCSGLGIIGKKPDIKYNISKESIGELVVLQRAIVDNAVRYIKRGGKMIFSTCTLTRAENQENVDYIKAKGLKCTGSRQFLPGAEDTDGFFYATFVKESE